MNNFIERNRDEIFKTLRELCLIPAPSYFEGERARYCRDWLASLGAKDAYIDIAGNVVLPLGCKKGGITVINAHLDTVFSDTKPMPYEDDGEIIRCPGVGDDTASVTVLLYAIKYFLESGDFPKDVLFVFNTCEEGLGNLKGIKQIFRDFDGRIERLVALDSRLDSIADKSVGSERYEVKVVTEGGHSYGNFGNKNAIAELSRIISEIYSIDVPKNGDSKTSYNVGEIRGGTSVNTIAEEAVMLAEYRSDDRKCLSVMRDKFFDIFDRAKKRGIDVRVDLIGERPCMGDVDSEKQRALALGMAKIISSHTGEEISFRPASTDCNIPLSIGIPAVSCGVYRGGGAHTRDEWLRKDSLQIGLGVCIKLVKALGGMNE